VRHIKSSALPDYVFGPGERQPKPVARKRPKQAKPAEKANNVSSDLPVMKKPRPSYNLASDSAPPSAQAVKSAENGVSAIPRAPQAVVATPTSICSVDVKDTTPALPFSESVAVATSTGAP